MSVDDHILNVKSPQDAERERLSRFPEASFDPDRPLGVLLSDEIEYYVRHFSLLYPFDPACLKPAAYELRVGDKYSRGGQPCDLARGQKIRIEPFEVAVIQTLETVNLPRFLIGRWNIRTGLAYKGLLWVGGPQVDAGFRGFLSCPLYNLSNKAVEIEHGEQIAVIDFVTTTPPKRSSIIYNWANRTRLTFEDYNREPLQSALLTEAAQKLKTLDEVVRKTEESIKISRADVTKVEEKVERTTGDIQTRVDSYTTTTFTVIAVLFAALGLVAVQRPDTSFWSSSIWLGALALWYAMRSYYLTRAAGTGQARFRIPLRWEIMIGIVLALIIISAHFRSSSSAASALVTNKAAVDATSQQVIDLRKTVEELRNDLSVEAKKNAEAIDHINARIDNIPSKPKSQQQPGSSR